MRRPARARERVGDRRGRASGSASRRLGPGASHNVEEEGFDATATSLNEEKEGFDATATSLNEEEKEGKDLIGGDATGTFGVHCATSQVKLDNANMDIHMVEEENLRAGDIQDPLVHDETELDLTASEDLQHPDEKARNLDAAEAYFSRLLFRHVQGARSFEDLRTVDGITYSTFKEACQQRGLTESDNYADECLSEASTMANPRAMRSLFAVILVSSKPADVRGQLT